MPIEPKIKARAVVRGILKNGGKFIRNGEQICILMGGRRIVVSPEFNNNAYAQIQIAHSGRGTVDTCGRAICQHVAILGSQQASDMRLAMFSAMAKDRTRMYVPVQGGELLEISTEGMRQVPNGANKDSVWLEHPFDMPFTFLPNIDVREALEEFEKLCVETQACTTPSHRWLVAMHEGLLPYVRQGVAARMLVEHSGPSQHGKTSGAQRFAKLHGLGEVLGDVSTAYLRNNYDGIGLMVLDNKEQASYGQDLISFLLFTATGARHGRSNQDGSAREMGDRPIGVLTSIEGLYKQELQKRTVCIHYGALCEKHRDRDYIEEQIELRRDTILSGLCHVLCEFLATNPKQVQECLAKLPRSPWPEFHGYVRVLASLLYAYAIVKGEPLAWADALVGGWFRTLGAASIEREEDVIEMHVFQALELYEAVRSKVENGGELVPAHGTLLGAIDRVADYDYGGARGTLYVTSAARLLSAMQANNIGQKDLPRNSSGMGKRLESGGWSMLQVLKEEDDPRLLRRSSNQRRIGIFRVNESATDGEVQAARPLHAGLLGACESVAAGQSLSDD